MKKSFLTMAVAIMTTVAISAQENNTETIMAVSTSQTDRHDGYEGDSAIRCGIRFNFQFSGITKVELESVDDYPLAGTADILKDAQGQTVVDGIENAATIITFSTTDKSGFTPGKDYYISTLPCDLYGGYRLSFYRDGLVAHYFGVHQRVEPDTCPKMPP